MCVCSLQSSYAQICLCPEHVYVYVSCNYIDIHCSSESLRWPTVGRYKVDIASFESLALPELQVEKDTDLFIIDEVGKMELFSSSFFPAVLKVLESNTPVLASIPIPKSGRDIPGVARLRNHPEANIFTLNPSNRDGATDQVHALLLNMLEQQH